VRSLLVSSPGFWRGLVDTVALAPDVRTACAAVAHEISRALETPTWIIEKSGDRFEIISTGEGVSADIGTLLTPALATDFERRAGEREFGPIDLGRWTAISIGSAERPMALIVAGDADVLESLLGPVALWLPAALDAVRERSMRARGEAFAVDAYRLARRAGRLDAVDAVCRQIAEQSARSLSAERVAIALYEPDEHGLAVKATHGYQLSAVDGARIEPGEWVMGHVFASRRAVVVRDVRRLRGLSVVARRYRTFSFAAVPIVVQQKVMGVLSATDKADGAAFARRDASVLRAIGCVGALGLVAARGDAESKRLTRAATIDSLTGLFNRQLFDLRLHQEVERARRTSSAVTVLLIDVDDFKSINDNYGHPAGDAVLVSAASILRSAVRVFDVCARYGGDEFAIVMPNSDRSNAAAAAERIRENIAASCSRLAGVAAPLVTVSVGGAVMDASEAPEEIVARADQTLYQAKAAGKNCSRIASSRRSPLSSVSRSDKRSDKRT